MCECAHPCVCALIPPKCTVKKFWSEEIPRRVTANDRGSQHLLSAYCVPSSVLAAFHASFKPSILRSRSHHLHFTNAEMRA